jgi:hypothetical protein
MTFQLSSESKHPTMRINAIHQEMVNKVMVIKYIDTKGNTVEILTKTLIVILFERHTRTLRHGFVNRCILAKAKKVDRPVTFKVKLKKISAARVRQFAYSN